MKELQSQNGTLSIVERGRLTASPSGRPAAKLHLKELGLYLTGSIGRMQ